MEEETSGAKLFLLFYWETVVTDVARMQQAAPLMETYKDWSYNWVATSKTA